MPQQFLHLIEAAAGVSKVAAESMPELMRRPPARQSGPPSGRSDQRADRIRPHRRTTAPRNKLTSKKSLACASGTPNRSNS